MLFVAIAIVVSAGIVYPSENGQETGFGGGRPGFGGGPGSEFGGQQDFFKSMQYTDHGRYNFKNLNPRAFAASKVMEFVAEKSLGFESACLSPGERQKLAENILAEMRQELAQEDPREELKKAIAEMEQYSTQACNPTDEMIEQLPDEAKEAMRALIATGYTEEGAKNVCRQMMGEQDPLKEMEESLRENYRGSQSFCGEFTRGFEGGFPRPGQFPGQPTAGQCPQDNVDYCNKVGGAFDYATCNCDTSGGIKPPQGTCTPEITNQCAAQQQICENGVCVGQQPTTTAPFCGDGACNENPTTCPADCGQFTQPPGGGQISPEEYCRQNPTAPECAVRASPVSTAVRSGVLGLFPLLQLQVTNPADTPEGRYPGGGGFGGGFPGGGFGGHDLSQFRRRGGDPCSSTEDEWVAQMVEQQRPRFEKQMERPLRQCAKGMERFVRQIEKAGQFAVQCKENMESQLKFMKETLTYLEEFLTEANLKAEIDRAVARVCAPVVLEAQYNRKLEQLEEKIAQLEAKQEALLKTLANLEEKAQRRLYQINLALSELDPRAAATAEVEISEFTGALTNTTTTVENVSGEQLNIIQAIFTGDSEKQEVLAARFASLNEKKEELQKALGVAVQTGDEKQASVIKSQIEDIDDLIKELEAQVVKSIDDKAGFFQRIFGFNAENFLEEHTES